MQKAFLVGVLLTGALVAQNTAPEKGAKALFLDPTSGAAVVPKKVLPTGQATAVKKPTDPPTVLNAGLMYYIERQRPDGQLERVNPSVIFRSGDRIRIQIKSNVEGRLAIAQRNPDGSSGVLFPDARVNGGDNRILTSQITALPSATTWFKFDDNPGEEHLLVMLTPEGNQTALGVIPDMPPTKWDSRRTQEVTMLAQTQKGSKALVIEVDDAKESPATYIVQPAGRVVPQGVITTEIVLHHR